MKRSQLVLALAIATLFPFSGAEAKSAMEEVFGCSGKTCVITYSPGGNPAVFMAAATDARKRGVSVRIVGGCYSACVIFASYARKNVCLAENAKMSIHRGKLFTPGMGGATIEAGSVQNINFDMLYFSPDYGPDLTQWAFDNNKMPYDGFYTLTKEEASVIGRPAVPDRPR